MSLSGQYLEELSRRYKKQVEELQVAFSKTLLIVEEQSKRSADREQQLCAQNDRLRDDVDKLYDRLGSWHQHVAYAISMLCVQFVWWLLRKLFTRSTRTASGLEDADEIPANLSTSNQSRSARLRRKSTDAIAGSTNGTGGMGSASAHGGNGDVGKSTAGVGTATAGTPKAVATTVAKRRRPSEEALHIGGTYAELMIDDADNDGELSMIDAEEEYDHFADPTNNASDGGALTERQQRKQRRNVVKRTKSLDQSSSLLGQRRLHGNHYDRNDNDSCDNLSANGAGSDADASSTAGSEPVLDENYEVYVPGSDMAYNEFMPDGPSGRSTPVGDMTTVSIGSGVFAAGHHQCNGNIAQASSTTSCGASLLGGKKKTDKLRRLSSPAFLKSPFSRTTSMSLGKASSKVSKKAAAVIGGQHEQTTGWEWYHRRKDTATVGSVPSATVMQSEATAPNSSQASARKTTTSNNKKSKSESPTLRTEQLSLSANGGDRSASTTALTNTSNNSSTRSSTVEKKQGSSLRRMLKKVF